MATIGTGTIVLNAVNDAYTVSLTRSSFVITASYDGSKPNLSGASAVITVKRGNEAIPFSASITGTSNDGITCLMGVDSQAAGLKTITPSEENTNDVLTNGYATSISVQLMSIPASDSEGYVEISITTANGYQTTIKISYTVVRESTMLDWIQDWNSNRTVIGGESIITPKIFAGTKEADETLTGVFIGLVNNSAGIYGYKKSQDVFHINGTEAVLGGWILDVNEISSPTGSLKMSSSGSIASYDDKNQAIWKLDNNGEASFASGKVLFKANGDASFEGEIKSTTGKIGGWSITSDRLATTHFALVSDTYLGIYLSLHDGTDFTVMPLGKLEDHVTNNGGIYMQFNGGTAEFAAFDHNGSRLFSLANGKDSSINYIAGWKFDNTGIWLGTKNNTSNQYTSEPGAITIGTNGIRGCSWRIDTNGEAAFANGKVLLSGTTSTISGWAINQSSLSSSNIRLSSTPDSSGIYIIGNGRTITSDAQDNSVRQDISTFGGMYLAIFNDNCELLGVQTTNQKAFFRLSTGAPSMIAGWSFDGDAIYYEEKCTTIGAFSTKGITMSPNGIRSKGWFFDNDGSGKVSNGNIAWNADGSGSLAGGKIAWNASGDITLSSSVQIGFGNLDSAISKKFTHITSEGIYTGILTADQVNALTCAFDKGMIGGWDINELSISKNNVVLGMDGSISNSNFWKLGNNGSGSLAKGNIAWGIDGSGYLAGGKIAWDASGNITLSSSVQIGFENLDLTISGKFTHITSEGIYTGTLTADQVNALECTFDKGKIGGWIISKDSISSSTQGSHVVLGEDGSISNGDLWKLNSDGSGSLASGKIAWNVNGSGSIAGGNIAWDASGDITLSSSVKIVFECSDPGTLGGKLTNITSNGIYTGTLTADQVNALACTFVEGTIGGWIIGTESISSPIEDPETHLVSSCQTKLNRDGSIFNTVKENNEEIKTWWLNSDGSGLLAKGNITWDKDGNLTVSGALKGVTGSFKSLDAVNNNNERVGGILLNSIGNMTFEGDIYHQGTTASGRPYRLYSSNLWCRGNFGAAERTIMVVTGEKALIYVDGRNYGTQEITLSNFTTTNGKKCYTIPCFGVSDESSGMPIDIVAFNIADSNAYYYELGMVDTQRVLVVNVNNNANNANVYINGSPRTWDGGSIAEVCKLRFIQNPQQDATILGAGLFMSGKNDENWSQ